MGDRMSKPPNTRMQHDRFAREIAGILERSRAHARGG
jgi:hypothetical protein